MSMQNDQDFKNYKTDEHQRINTVIYSAALTAIAAIYLLRGHENTVIFIVAFIWALLSYSYWFFAEMHIATHADRDNQKTLYIEPTDEVKKLGNDLHLLIKRCRDWNLYTIIISWFLNVLGASLTFFHGATLPHWIGWIGIYGSLVWVVYSVIKEHRASDAWSARLDKI